jgi:C1A family cysteine protease
MTETYRFGALPSPPDARDYQIAAYMPVDMPALPPEMDLRPCLQPVLNQGQRGACVTFAIAACLMGYMMQTGAAPLHRILSEDDLYELTRDAEGAKATPWGSGLAVRDALEVARKQGICLSSTRPYVAEHPTNPGPTAPAERAMNRLLGYAAVDVLDIAAQKAALIAKGPQVTASAVSDGFAYPDRLSDGSYIISQKGGLRDGHAYGIVGWSDKRQCWLIRNSWGTGWADGGHAWLPYVFPRWEGWAAVQNFQGQPVIDQFLWLEQLVKHLGITIPGWNG